MYLFLFHRFFRCSLMKFNSKKIREIRRNPLKTTKSNFQNNIFFLKGKNMNYCTMPADDALTCLISTIF